MDINSKIIVDIINKLAEKYEVKPDVVRRVVMSEFECVRSYIKEADSASNYFPKIWLPYLFTFMVRERRKESLKRKREEDVYNKRREATDRGKSLVHT